MKVAMIARATLYSGPGGDTKQMDLTAACLRTLGVEVDIILTDRPVDYHRYDLLHFFNVIRPADIAIHVQRSGKPFVISTIFVDYGAFEKETRRGMMGVMNRVVSEEGIEYLKVVARRLRNGEKIMSRRYLWRGHAHTLHWVLSRAAMLLPNSESEYRRITQKYGVKRPYRVVPNGVDASIAKHGIAGDPAYRDTVICMARIEALKNQLNLVRALSNTPYRVVIHGRHSPNHEAYYRACRAGAGPNIQFEGWVSDQQALYAIYGAAKVHVLPSYFETTGLSSLEAAVMGCNIVVTDRGDTRDYFGDNAWYCNPDDPASIKAAVDAAFSAPYNESFRDYILHHYTWQRAAEETLAAYRQVLG